MTRKQWVRRRVVTALVLLPLGVVLMLWGAIKAVGEHANAWFAVGLVGVLLVTFGALAGRYAVAGPFPDLEGDT